MSYVAVQESIVEFIAVHVTASQLANRTEMQLRPQKYYAPYQTVVFNNTGVDFAMGTTSYQRNEQNGPDSSN